jgi:hypothetical protein
VRLFRKYKSPIELIELRGRIENNIGLERLKEGIEEQYKQLHDPAFAKEILLQNISDVKKWRGRA